MAVSKCTCSTFRNVMFKQMPSSHWFLSINSQYLQPYWLLQQTSEHTKIQRYKGNETRLSHAMCHVLSAALDTIILQYSTSFLYCTNIKIHEGFIKCNVRKTVNPILVRLRLLKVLFDLFELNILLIKTQSRLESPGVLP